MDEQNTIVPEQTAERSGEYNEIVHYSPQAAALRESGNDPFW